MATVPGTEPLNLLALDGGGIRGVSELLILHEVMLRVQERGELLHLPKPCAFFHIMGGTSTGGLVAIMLGRLGMSTEDAIKAYDKFAGEIFSDKNRKKNPGQRWTQMYKATGLSETVQHLVAQQDKGELMRDKKELHDRGRSFVCSKTVGDRRKTVRLRTYDVTGDLYRHVGIWEAARATTAAPMYFKPMKITNDAAITEDLIDGAIGCNNPTEILLEEADLLYGKQRKLGCVVSLGTGTKVQELEEASNGIRRKASWAKSLALVMKEITVDCEETHDRAMKKFQSFPNAYFRFNVAGGAQDIKLEDWTKMEELKLRTHAYLRQEDVRKMVDDLADVLLQKGPAHGLNLGHIGELHKDSIQPDTDDAIPRGRASRIFTGRTNILRKMDNIFGEREPGCDERREFHLRGLGGVGKTQIALYFADSNDRRFHVIWIDATNSSTMEQSYSKYAERWFQSKDPKLAVQLCLQWLEETDVEWLLVFDNAPERGLQRYIPDGGRGNIIYTSRPHRLEQRLRPECIQDVDTMEPADAVTLLLKAACIDARDVAARKTARPIVDELGCLPLAIDQAGAYINMAPCHIESYLEVYEREKETLLRDPPFRGEDERRNLPIYTTFNISLDVIRAYSERRRDMGKVQHAISAMHLLSVLCFYHNEGQVRAIFSCASYGRASSNRNKHFPLIVNNVCVNELVETKDGLWHSTVFDQGIKFLRDFSLIKFDDETEYSMMHILVHEWARGRLDKGTRAQYGLVARSILFDSIKYKGAMFHALHRRDALPHVEACHRYYGGRHENDILESEYESKYAIVQKEACNFKEAESALKRAIYLRQFEYTLSGEPTLVAMMQLAEVYQEAGRFGDAEAILLEVLTRRQMALLEMKGEVYGRNQKPKGWDYPGEFGAQLSAPTPSQIKGKQPERVEGSGYPMRLNYTPDDDAQDDLPIDDRKIISYKVQLSQVYREQDRLQLAKEQMEDVVRGYTRKHGPNSDYRPLKSAISFLATLEQVQAGRYQPRSSWEAREELYLSEQSHGPTAPRTIDMKERLANALKAEHQFEEAYEIYSELFCYYSEHYGEEALETVDLTSQVADMFQEADSWVEAEGLYRIALGVRQRKLGRNHPDTLDSLNNLTLTLIQQARLAEALPLIEECAERRAAVLGADHVMTKANQSLLKRSRRLQKACTPAITTHFINVHNEKARVTMGAHAPQWLRDWQPTPVVVSDAEKDAWKAALQATEAKVCSVDGNLEIRCVLDDDCDSVV